MRSSEPFNHFVDDYLAYLHEVHPTSATLDGVHTHDDLLEDLSRQGIEQDTRALAGFSRRLQDLERPQRNVVEIADGRGHDVQAGGHAERGYCTL